MMLFGEICPVGFENEVENNLFKAKKVSKEVKAIEEYKEEKEEKALIA